MDLDSTWPIHDETGVEKLFSFRKLITFIFKWVLEEELTTSLNLDSRIELSPRRFRLPKKFGEVTKVTVVTFSTCACRWLGLPFQSVTHIKANAYPIDEETRVKLRVNNNHPGAGHLMGRQ